MRPILAQMVKLIMRFIIQTMVTRVSMQIPMPMKSYGRQQVQAIILWICH